MPKTYAVVPNSTFDLFECDEDPVAKTVSKRIVGTFPTQAEADEIKVALETQTAARVAQVATPK